MSYSFQDLFKESEVLARSLGHRYILIDHLAASVMCVPSVDEAMKSMNVDASKVRDRIISYLEIANIPAIPDSVAASISEDSTPVSILVSRVMSELAKQAVIEQLKEADYSISSYFVLFECLSFPDTALEAALSEFGLNRTEAARALKKHVEHIDSSVNLSSISDEPTKTEGKKVAGAAQQSKAKGFDDYTTNLTELARTGKLDPLVGREKEVQALIEAISRKTKKNAVLTGEAGVGKTQIVDGLAIAIAEGKVPEHIKDLEIYSLSIAALTAGTKYRGEFEERMEDLLKELRTRENAILFIDEMHTMMSAGSSSEGSMGMSNLIKPALSRGEIRVIGATTYEEYRKHIEKDGALARRFMKIDVLEPTLEETREIVNGVKKNYEEFHNVSFSTAAIDAIMELSSKFLQNKRFPDKAIDLLDAAAAKNRAKKKPKKIISRSDIEEVVSVIANLNIDVVSCNESERMSNLPEKLRERVYGQDEAIDKLVDNVMVARAGLRDSTSVQGAFMFVGPSGTGKTEISKALADAMGVELIRFDMSEFSESHTISKLIGSPPGYVGHDSGNGLLLDKIEEFPNCVLLLDEIEKADKKVLLTFLQVLDEGRLTGSKGKTVYFNNVTVIMTTNLGASSSNVRTIAGSSSVDGQEKIIKKFLPPEFINRIDAVVKFNDLNEQAIDSVINKFIGQLNDIVSKRNITVSITDNARKWFSENGVQPGMGARPMKRIIEEHIRVPLSKEILCGSLQKGGDVVFDEVQGKIVMVK